METTAKRYTMAEQFIKSAEDETDDDQPKKPIPRVIEGVISWDDSGNVTHKKISDDQELLGIKRRLIDEQIKRAEIADVIKDEAEAEDNEDDEVEAEAEVAADTDTDTEKEVTEAPALDGNEELDAPEERPDFPEVTEILAAQQAADERWSQARDMIEMPIDKQTNQSQEPIEISLDPETSIEETDPIVIPDQENIIDDSPDYSEAYTPPAQQVHQAQPENIVLEPKPSRGMGLLGLLLGAEFLARRRADKKQEVNTKEYIDQKIKAYEISTPEIGQPSQPEILPPVYATPEATVEAPLPIIEIPPVQPFGPEEAPVISLNEGQHIEHSAWHNVIVDKHGHEVADAIQYGQGFHQEQQELRRDPSPVQTTQAGGVSMLPNGAYTQQQASAGLPSGMIMQELPSGNVLPTDIKHQLPEHASQSFSTNTSMAWIVVMVVIIVVAYFVAALM